MTITASTSTAPTKGLFLRNLRKQKGLTATDVAMKTGYTASHIGNFELGSDKFSLKTFLAICNALEVNPSDLDHLPHAPAKNYGYISTVRNKKKTVVSADDSLFLAAVMLFACGATGSIYEAKTLAGELKKQYDPVKDEPND